MPAARTLRKARAGWRARRDTAAALVIFLAALVAAFPAPHDAQSGAGQLDATFGGGDGRVHDNFGEIYRNQANAVVVQPDGKLVAGGFASCCSNDGTEDFALARYNADGSLDTGFGGDGVIKTDFLGRFDTDDEIYALALQADGKIVAAGQTETDLFLGTADYAIARYTGAPGTGPPTPTPPLPTPIPVTPLMNHASAANGATAAVSSTLDPNRAPLAAINGDRRGLHWGTGPTTGSGWHCATQNAFPTGWKSPSTARRLSAKYTSSPSRTPSPRRRSRPRR